MQIWHLLTRRPDLVAYSAHVVYVRCCEAASLLSEIYKLINANSGDVKAQLSSLTKEFTATSAAAQRTLKGLFGRRPAKPVVDVDSMPTARLRPGYGGSTGALLIAPSWHMTSMIAA